MSAFALLAILTSTGCNGANSGTVVVEGDVAYDGTAVASGEIRFLPEGSTKARVSGTQIQDGHYRINKKQTLLPGVYRVEVRGFRNTDGSEGPIDFGDPEAAYVQYLPGKYNTKSQLSITIEPDSPRELRHDLDLTP